MFVVVVYLMFQEMSSREVPKCSGAAGCSSEPADSAPDESSQEDEEAAFKDDWDVSGGQTVGGAF